MTLSILAMDASTGAIGGAAATGNLAVGAWVLRVAAGVGAVATQGHSVSPLWGDQSLQRLHLQESAEQVLQHITSADTGRDFRQLSVLDRHGRGAAFTGVQNTPERGHRLAESCVVAGNWLSSLAVLDAMQESYVAHLEDASQSLADRLLAALHAGIAAGSDSRGTQSAALKVVSTDQPPLDLRVDYDEHPLARLDDLYRRATSEPYAGWMQLVPTLDEPYRY